MWRNARISIENTDIKNVPHLPLPYKQDMVHFLIYIIHDIIIHYFLRLNYEFASIRSYLNTVHSLNK